MIADALLAALSLAARYAKPLLVAGLVAGVALPALADRVAANLPLAAAGLLFFAALRIGPRAAFGARRDLPLTLAAMLVLQLALPVALAMALLGLGWTGALASALVLMAMAPPISGAANLAVMAGADPAPALRMQVVATAALPLTVVPVLLLWPAFGGMREVFEAVARTLIVLTLSVGAGFAIRATLIRDPGPKGLSALDGAASLFMALAVTGLMTALPPALRAAPASVVWTMLAAFAASFGQQIAVGWLLRRRSEGPALAIGAGCRNLILFLAVLPVAVTQPLMLFVACYQVPMYLTPVLLGRFHRRARAPATASAA